MTDQKEEVCHECGGEEVMYIEPDRVRACICMVERKHQDQVDMEIRMLLEDASNK